ncbi:MAG: hypothetical protein QN120_02465 [Armatimonadota bacterium]|nr:hypothetical protein [Armatimonadota bacterium]
MEWGAVWRTIFCGWDGEVDLATLARELAERGGRVGAVDDQDAAAWVCRQIQEAY